MVKRYIEVSLIAIIFILWPMRKKLSTLYGRYANEGLISSSFCTLRIYNINRSRRQFKYRNCNESEKIAAK